MNLETLKTAKALEKQINAINKVLKPIEDVETGELSYKPDRMTLYLHAKDGFWTSVEMPKYLSKIAMDRALESLKVARDKMIEELEKL